MTMDKGIYVTLDELLALQSSASSITQSLSMMTRNMLQGNRPSKTHGRGGAFDQIREYMTGDDVRNIDWKVTARIGKPFVRVFNEERETPMFILADQSADMFFATRKQMKSVVAAKIAGYLLWMSHHRKRPCGGVIFGDKQHNVYRPRDNTSHIYGMLEQLVHYNQQLTNKSHQRSKEFTFVDSLQHLNQVVSKDAFVVLISDFMQVNAESWQLIERLSLKSNVIATTIYDGLVDELPNEGQFLASYEELEAELDFSSYVSRNKVSQGSQGRINEVNQRFSELAVPVLQFSTYQDVEQQLLSGLFIDGGQHA